MTMRTGFRYIIFLPNIVKLLLKKGAYLRLEQFLNIVQPNLKNTQLHMTVAPPQGPQIAADRITILRIVAFVCLFCHICVCRGSAVKA